jgi:microcompartment protein CcmK/EutM
VTLCRVIGPVVATVKHAAFRGYALLAVQPIAGDGTDMGGSLLAIDHAQAGAGDRVLVLREGNGVRQVLGSGAIPVRSVIVGIVDHTELEGRAG